MVPNLGIRMPLGIQEIKAGRYVEIIIMTLLQIFCNINVYFAMTNLQSHSLNYKTDAEILMILRIILKSAQLYLTGCKMLNKMGKKEEKTFLQSFLFFL